MTLLALLLGLVYPACARPGVEGLPPPRPIDPVAIVRPSSPNTALAAPAGFQPTPDVVVPTVHMAPAALFRALREVAAQQPRTTLQAAYDDRLQAQYVVRSAVLNFPDLVMVQAMPTAAGGAGVVIWSRSVYGWGDLGANRKRTLAWLVALRAVPAVAQAGREDASPAPAPAAVPDAAARR